jgi:hypothetical protein
MVKIILVEGRKPVVNNYENVVLTMDQPEAEIEELHSWWQQQVDLGNIVVADEVLLPEVGDVLLTKTYGEVKVEKLFKASIAFSFKVAGKDGPGVKKLTFSEWAAEIVGEV